MTDESLMKSIQDGETKDLGVLYEKYKRALLVLISLAEALKKIGASQSADQFQNQISKEMPSAISDAFEKDLHSILTDKI